MPVRASVRQAVNAFLVGFQGVSSVSASIDRFLVRLSSDPAWSEFELAVVRRDIHRRLFPGTLKPHAKAQTTLVTRNTGRSCLPLSGAQEGT